MNVIHRNFFMLVKELISLIKEVVEDEIDLFDETPLVGGSTIIDSMNLVLICIALEEKSHTDNFQFDWRSEKIMSSINSIFKTPSTLCKEYNRQMNK